MTAPLHAVASRAQYVPPILAQPVYYYGGAEPISELTPHDLRAHLRDYGQRPDCREAHGVALLEAIDEANLTGRGGAHLPSAIKWRAVRAAARGRGAVVVANGAEGEPASRKDAALLQLRPHLVLDGLACAAEALGAERTVIWLHEGAYAVRNAVGRALAERAARASAEPRIEVALGPDAYLTGESGAVVRALSGGPALPDYRTVPSAVSGVDGTPTLVHNVETLVHVAQLARGVVPASALVTVCVSGGRIVLEAPTTEVLRDVVARVVGGEVTAVLLGGYGGSWCSWANVAELRLAEPEMRARRLSLGAGVLEVLRPGTCGLTRTAEIAAYLAGQSAGQCGPCVFGLKAVAEALRAVVRGGRRARRGALLLSEYAEEVRGRGACHLPDGAVRMVTSALDVFADDLAAHVDGRCAVTRIAI